jgi:AraC-like DNA-binding protein
VLAFARRENVFPWNWHYHPEIELTWIKAGRGRRLVGDHAAPYRAGDFVLLGPNLPHTWVSETGRKSRAENRAIVVQFPPPPGAFLALPEMARVRALLGRASRGLAFPEAARRRLERDLEALVRRNGVARWNGLVGILDALADWEGAPLASAHYLHGRTHRLSSRLGRIVDEIDRSYRGECSLAEMAARAGMTPGSFSRFFHRMTRETFVDYRNRRRIREACRLLEETDLPITRIAYEVGFNNLANFNRRFRAEKRMVPREFRRQYYPGIVD